MVPTPRDRRHELDVDGMRDWRDRDPLAAIFYASLSSLFPQGERFFMDSLRPFRGRATPELQEQIRAFISQEAIHSREHVSFNEQVSACGYDMVPLEVRTTAEVREMRRGGDLHQLALTVGLEHFTAILARHLLVEPAHLASAPEEARRLWRWHAGEEIEHRAVAFDVLQIVLAHRFGAERWAYRCAVYLEAVVRLMRVCLSNLRALRAQHGRSSVPWTAFASYLLFRPGLLRRMAPDLAAFLRPGFHPSGEADDILARIALAPD